MSYSKISAIVAAVMLAAGLSAASFAQQSAAPSGAPSGGGSLGYQQSGADGNAAGPTGGSRPLDVPVLYVTGIEVLHATLEPKVDVIRVTGLVSSAGWSNPQLVPLFYGKPADDVLDLQFIATSPEQSQKAEGFQPVSADFTLEAGHAFKGVRVRAYGNALELKGMNGTAKAEIKAND